MPPNVAFGGALQRVRCKAGFGHKQSSLLERARHGTP